jgi:hypothetical protein
VGVINSRDSDRHRTGALSKPSFLFDSFYIGIDNLLSRQTRTVYFYLTRTISSSSLFQLEEPFFSFLQLFLDDLPISLLRVDRMDMVLEVAGASA